MILYSAWCFFFHSITPPLLRLRMLAVESFFFVRDSPFLLLVLEILLGLCSHSSKCEIDRFRL